MQRGAATRDCSRQSLGRAAEPEDQRRLPTHLQAHDRLHLLQSEEPFNFIAVWLGYEDTYTTHRYLLSAPAVFKAFKGKS